MTTAQDGGKVVSLITGRLYPPGNTPGTHSVIVRSEGFYVNEKISNDISWDRTNLLPICSTAP